jgi:hypothetical protein
MKPGSVERNVLRDFRTKILNAPGHLVAVQVMMSWKGSGLTLSEALKFQSEKTSFK